LIILKEGFSLVVMFGVGTEMEENNFTEFLWQGGIALAPRDSWHWPLSLGSCNHTNVWKSGRKGKSKPDDNRKSFLRLGVLILPHAPSLHLTHTCLLLFLFVP
jgi:hypothetical protein